MPADARALLAARARDLARPTAAVGQSHGRLMLFFTLGGEQLALEARWLLGVTRLGSLTVLPGAEAPLRGVTVWQGELLTVLDIRSLLGISTAGLSDMTRLLVLGERRARFGLIVDAVGECVSLEDEDMHDASEASRAQAYLLGITSDARLVLDGARLLELFE